MNVTAIKKFCHDLRLVCWDNIMHEMVTLKNTSKCEKMLFLNVDINASFHYYIFRKEVQTSPSQISTESSPHHYTARAFNGFNRKFWVVP